MDYIEKTNEMPDPNIHYLKAKLILKNQMRNNTRYIAMAEKTNLPVKHKSIFKY